jgi:hypothetical protein
LQHLYAYGCKTGLPSGETKLDPRFDLVTRGIATYWEQLAGRWAVPGYDKATYSTPEKAMAAGNTYGQKIKALFDQLMAMSVSEADVERYFPSKVEAPKQDVTEQETTKPEAPEEKPETPKDTTTKPEVEDNKPEIDTEKVNNLLDILTKILTYILDFFKKK